MSWSSWLKRKMGLGIKGLYQDWEFTITPTMRRGAQKSQQEHTLRSDKAAEFQQFLHLTYGLSSLEIMKVSIRWPWLIQFYQLLAFLYAVSRRGIRCISCMHLHIELPFCPSTHINHHLLKHEEISQETVRQCFLQPLSASTTEESLLTGVRPWLPQGSRNPGHAEKAMDGNPEECKHTQGEQYVKVGLLLGVTSRSLTMQSSQRDWKASSTALKT